MTDITTIPQALRMQLRLIEQGGRRTGRTTRMIKDAPKNAVIICANDPSRIHTQGIAMDAGRRDLKVINGKGPSRPRLAGRSGQIIYDHFYLHEYWDAVIKDAEKKLQYTISAMECFSSLTTADIHSKTDGGEV